MKALLKPLNALAAEWVGLGSNRKHTIVNCYTGSIVVAEFPARIPLAFYVEVMPHAKTPKLITIKLKVGRKTKAEVLSHFEFEDGKLALLTLPPLLVEIPKPLDIKIEASGEGYNAVTLFKISVEQGDIN